MRKILSAAIAFVSMCAPAAFAADGDIPTLRLKYSVHTPSNNVIAEGDAYFAKLIKEKSGGKITVDVYWNRSLGGLHEMLPLISAGAVDITTLETSMYGETPLLGLMNSLPLTFFDAETVLKIAHALYENSAPTKAELKRIGARVVMVRHLPNYQLLCTKPYRTMADLKGARLRSYGGYVPVMWNAIGANGVNVTTNELYDGLSKGTFDCAYLPPPIHAALKLYEPARYLIDIPFGMIEYAPTMIPTVVWDAWPESVKKIVAEAGKEAEAFARKHTEENAGESIAFMQRNGVQVVHFEQLAELKKAVPDMIEIWQKKQSQAGRGAQADEIAKIVRPLMPTK